ncbi:MAG: hypothetical protein QXU98_10125, partial [Candidatus Parvarchaeota archaeon]
MKTVHSQDEGQSDIIATAIVISIVVMILASAIYVIDIGLPGKVIPSATVVDNNVTFRFVAGNTGYLTGSFLYSAGPPLNTKDSYFLLFFNGTLYKYPLSSFLEAGNTWTNITGGTLVIFNSSVMIDSNGSIAPLLTVGENYTLELVDSGTAVWVYHGTALATSSKPVIAYSWFTIVNSNAIDVFAAVYGNSSVTVTGNFSSLYGSLYRSTYLSPTDSPGVYYVGLPAPPESGYYQIVASLYGYKTDEWFFLNWTTIVSNNNTPNEDSLNIFFNGIPSSYFNQHGINVEITNPATVSTFTPAMVTSNQYAWYGKWLSLTSNQTFNDSALQGTTQSIAIQINFPVWLRLSSIQAPSNSNLIKESGNIFTDNYSIEYITFIVNKNAPTNVYVNFNAQKYVFVNFAGFPSWGKWNGTLFLNGTSSLAPETFTLKQFNDFSNVTWVGKYYVALSLVDVNTHQKFNITYGDGNVLNANQNVTIYVNATTPPIRYYSIFFDEQGLPSGTSWQVELNGSWESSTSDQISFSLPNGSYNWVLAPVSGYHADAYSGVVDVAGSNVTVSIIWSQVKYAETFIESGLPVGTTWGVTVGNIYETSDTSIIVFDLPNATYSWKLGNVPGWTGSPYQGSITVDGTGGNVSITFVHTLYTVTFEENGLPSGFNWYVTFNGTQKSSISN